MKLRLKTPARGILSLVLILVLTIDLSAQGFVHPGGMHSREDLDFVKAKIQSGEQPWQDAYQQFLTAKAAPFQGKTPQPYSSLSYQHDPEQNVRCGSFNNPNIGCNDIVYDGMAAYSLALRFYFTDDQSYATKAIEIIRDWSNVYQESNESNTRLVVSWATPWYVNAAEILRYTAGSGWTSSNTNQMNTLLNRFKNYIFWEGRPSNNWMMSSVEARLAIAVFQNDQAAFDTAIGKWKERIKTYIYQTSDGSTPVNPAGETTAWTERIWHDRDNRTGTIYVNGLCMETCRDINHTKLGFNSLMNGAEIAWTQGEDLFALEQKRIGDFLELHANWMMGGNVPNNICDGFLDIVSEEAFEIAYNQLNGRLGISLPNTFTMINNGNNRPKSASRWVTKWETLMYANRPFNGSSNGQDYTIESVDEEQAPNIASNLYDGNTTDDARWSAQVFPKSVVIDLGETKSIEGINVWTYQNRAYQYTVSLSDSPNSGFSQVVDRSGNTSGSQPLSNTFDLTTGRYLRLTITGASGYSGSWISINEIEIQEADLTVYPNILSTTGEQAPNLAANLLDGNVNDDFRWSVQAFPSSVVIDYGEPKSITGTRVYTYAGRAYQYRVEGSLSPTSGYTTIVDRTGNTSTAQPITNSFSAVSARYLRLTVTGASGYSGSWTSINEFEIIEGGGSTTVDVDGVSLSSSNLSLDISQTAQLTATISPANASNQNVSWNSSNNTVATVSSTGLVTAFNSGTAVITVTSLDGGFSATTNVTVNEANNNGTDGDISLRYQVGDSDPSDNRIKANIILYNDGNTAISYSDLTVRYWFTQEGSSGSIVTIDYAAIGNANVSGTVLNAGGNSRYAELSFSSGAGSLTAGANSGNIKMRVNYSNFANHNESNDYSYDGNQSAYAAYDKITVYQNGSLIWGTEPSGSSRVTSLEESSSDQVVYPNPSGTGIFNLVMTSAWTVQHGTTGKNIIEGKGRVVDLSNYPNGFYILRTTQGIFKISKF